MRRAFLWLALILLFAVIVGAATFLTYQHYPWLFSTKYTVRIATGPVTQSGDRFIATFRREMETAHPRVQLKFVQVQDLDASADALKKGEVDAALVRSDNPTVAEMRTLVVMRKVAAMVVLGPQSEAEDWSDLKGKTIGVLTTSGTIDPLQKIILDFYDIPEKQIRLVTPKDIGAQIAEKRIAALLAIGSVGPGAVSDAIRAIRSATKKPAKFLDFEEADAIAERYPAYEKLDISQGAFGGSPLMPPESATAVAATVRLVATPKLSNYTAGELTRVILATKARLAGSEPGAGQIEAPDTDKPVFPIHPGTLSYLAGEKPTLLDDSLNYLYFGSMIFGAFGSVGAWLAAIRTRRLQKDIQERVAALPTYLGAIKAATGNDLDKIESELDELSEWLVEHYVSEKIPTERYGAIEAKLAEIRTIMTRRRAISEKGHGARLVTEAA